MQKLVGDLDGHSLGVCSGKIPSHRHKAYHGSPTRRMILKQRIHFGLLSFVFILHTTTHKKRHKSAEDMRRMVFQGRRQGDPGNSRQPRSSQRIASCIDRKETLEIQAARSMMANQSDFLEQLSSLATTVEFDPKYHCETNFIEGVERSQEDSKKEKKNVSSTSSRCASPRDDRSVVWDCRENFWGWRPPMNEGEENSRHLHHEWAMNLRKRRKKRKPVNKWSFFCCELCQMLVKNHQ